MEHLQIFIAEDDPVVLMGYKSMLRILDHDVCGWATNGADAVLGVLKQKPDLVIMDINMPKCDGISAADKILQILNVPIILITGYHSDNFANRSAASGAYYYLQKPIDEVNLQSAIQISYARYKDSSNLEERLSKANQALTDASNELLATQCELASTKQALSDRKLIERAKGILMDKFHMSENAAMKYLQTSSQKKNIKIVAAAQDIISADKEFDF